MNEYDKNALIEIEKWKNPPKTWLDNVTDAVGKPIGKVTDVLLDNKLGEAVSKAMHGLLTVINDGTSWSVRKEAILKEYRDKGYPSISQCVDIQSLELKNVDKVVGFLSAKYNISAFVEGAATGYLGIRGIAADIPALFAINLRAIGEYATYYGFDIENQAERAYILNVMMLSSSPSIAAKQATLAELAKIASAIAKNKTWKEIEKNLSAAAMKKIAEALGIRMTKGKMAQIVPVVGALVGGGYNSYFTSCTCETAFQLYRERFLKLKHGEPEIINV